MSSTLSKFRSLMICSRSAFNCALVDAVVIVSRPGFDSSFWVWLRVKIGMEWQTCKGWGMMCCWGGGYDTER